MASIGENSTSSQYCLACATAARAWPLTSSRVVWSWCSMWMSLVEMKVWIRGRSESLTAFQAASMSCTLRAGEAGDHRALDLAGDRLDGLEVARRGDREAGLDDVDAEARELLRDLELLLRVERDAGRLLAVAQRRVEDPYSVRLARVLSAMSFPSFLLHLFLLACGFAAATRYSPRGGRRGEVAGRAERHPRTAAATRVRDDLSDVLALDDEAVGLGARSSGNASATTGRSLPCVDPVAERVDESSRSPWRPRG